MNDEAQTINDFLDMCAESLDPENMESVRVAVGWLCRNRHIHSSQIREWGITELSPSENDPVDGQFGVGI